MTLAVEALEEGFQVRLDHVAVFIREMVVAHNDAQLGNLIEDEFIDFVG